MRDATPSASARSGEFFRRNVSAYQFFDGMCNHMARVQRVVPQMTRMHSHALLAKKGLCCGNSLGGIQLNSVQRDLVRMDTLTALLKQNPDYIITGCPLCKKTLAKGAHAEVKDIAEIVAMSMK